MPLRNYVIFNAPQGGKITFEISENVSNVFSLMSYVVFVLCGRFFEKWGSAFSNKVEKRNGFGLRIYISGQRYEDLYNEESF